MCYPTGTSPIFQYTTAGLSYREVNVLDEAFIVAEKVSIVALGLLAAVKNFSLFAPSFFIGSAIGIYDYFNNRPSAHLRAAAGCTQSFLEQLTGIKLPRPVSLAANVAITACHIDHHDSVFVPLVGLSVGAWATKAAAAHSVAAAAMARRLITNFSDESLHGTYARFQRGY